MVGCVRYRCRAVERRDQEFVLRVEMPVDRGLGHARATGHLVDGEAVEADFCNELMQRLDNMFSRAASLRGRAIVLLTP